MWVDQLHAQAILALLAAAPPGTEPGPALVVHHDAVIPPGAVPPYARPYIYTAATASTSIRHQTDRVVTIATIHCVGANDTAARAVAGRVAAALLDVTPTIAGRTCFPIRCDGTLPVDKDESTGPLVMDQVVTYRLESLPA